MQVKLNKKYNANGIMTLTAKFGTKRAISVQTSQNLPIAHGCDNNTLTNCAHNRARVLVELRAHLERSGTKAQKEAIL